MSLLKKACPHNDAASTIVVMSECCFPFILSFCMKNLNLYEQIIPNELH